MMRFGPVRAVTNAAGTDLKTFSGPFNRKDRANLILAATRN
jgi:hypothetical protein